tara:strand:+ start:405 stop:971 length:567 start_codon:yes stop_codon:yes gene_type:complete
MSNKTQISLLTEGDVFFMDGEKYTVLSNAEISTSFNEITAICENENVNIRARKSEDVYLRETSTIVNKTIPIPAASPTKVRNDKGNIIYVSFAETLTEQKLTKDQIKKRDTCADELLNNPEFKERYSNSDNVKAPGRDINDVAFGICTNRATGKENKRGSRSKKETNESFDRLNTVKDILRRISNEKI